jgi:NAD(P)-dependent dehydrogenase (short-subunit alcohol dehydrogenase family)
MQRPRIAVITGASAGIGRAVAREFASQGVDVALLARGQDGLDAARAEAQALGVRALALSVDVADAQAVEAAADRVEAELGPIDVWVNDAMATIYAPALDIAAEDFRRATEVTYLGAAWGTLAALRRMQPRNRGCIVQVGSALAYRSIPLQAPYCGAKAALRGFTDSLRSELLHQRCRVHLTMVQLSAFNTPQFDWGRTTLREQPQPMGKVFQPELAARAIWWAATHRRRELWVGWPAVQAIVTHKFFPGLLDRLLARTAVEGQSTGEPLPAHRPDNLWAPVPGDHGAHGRFGMQAHAHSAQLRLDLQRGWLAAALLGLVALGAAGWWARGRRRWSDS